MSRLLCFFLFLLTGGSISVHCAAELPLVWKSSAGFRAASVLPASEHGPGFSLLAPPQTGLVFSNLLSEQRHLTNQILLNGSGVAAGDVDADGLTDLYFCGLDAANALYKNLGNWKFQDITASAGVACADLLATAAALVDLDGDVDLDLIVNSVGQGTHLFFNDGRGHFNKSAQVLNEHRGGMSLAFGDLDGDGFLDLYAANYRTLGLMDIPNARATFKTINGNSFVETFNGRPTTAPDLTNRFSVGSRGGIEEHGEPDLIARNMGGTNFTAFPPASFSDETGRALASELFDWGLAVAIRDVNGDLLPDLYVCNDFQTADRLWINQGAGKFRLAPPLTQRKTSMFSMSVDFADINRDGYDDFMLADMLSRSHVQRMRDMADAPAPQIIGEIENRPQYSLNTLFLNRGDQSYAEIAQLSRIQASDWSWSCIFLDVDLDGWEDILVSNGMERAARDLDISERMKAMRATRRLSDADIFRARKAFPRLATANLAFRNKRDLTFEEAGSNWNFNLPGVSHGMALADLDNDGDLDVVINNLNAPAAIYRNESSAARVAVRLKGTPPNTRGIGAKIRVIADGLPIQSQEMIAGSRYLSSDDPVRSFAAGQSASMKIEVRWRDGKVTQLSGLPPNHIYEIDQTLATAPPHVPATNGPTLFADVSALLSHTVSEEPFDDFARQPLLPRKLGQAGPASAWADLNNDGWEDLIIGGARHGTLAVFQNNQQGGFDRVKSNLFAPPLKRDLSSLAAARLGLGSPVLLAALSNYEDGLGYGPAVQGYLAGSAANIEVASAWDSAAGPMALADVDRDGDLDLFIGGTVIPGRYPAPASSRMLLNENGKFTPDKTNERLLTSFGLVNGAVFADIDSDLDLDLLLACEWSPVRLLLNEKGAFTDATERFGLSKMKGLWNGIAAGDFDEDGRIDFVASNWGRNSKYEEARAQPAKLFFADFDDDGTFDLIESHFDAELAKYVPDRQRTVLGASLPFVNDRFRSHAAFSKAGVNDLLGEQLPRASVVEADWFESTLFLNRGDHFEARPLPIEAQFAPIFGICVADFDNDSHEDVVLAQNFFAVSAETPRYDAGRSLLLRGNGQGAFQSVPGQESGLLVYGEQRSVSTSDFDHDGRADLVLTQNGASVKLYRNKSAPAGLRIILEGARVNPDAIGASFRLTSGETRGARRLLTAGSGYAAQNAAAQVIAKPHGPAILEITWPDGAQSKFEVAPGKLEVRPRHPAER